MGVAYLAAHLHAGRGLGCALPCQRVQSVLRCEVRSRLRETQALLCLLNGTDPPRLVLGKGFSFPIEESSLDRSTSVQELQDFV